MNQYKQIMNKANVISKSQFIKQLKIEGSCLCEIYKKSPGDVIQRENIMVLCLFTDFRVLSKHFRDTFIVDSMDKKQKNKEYWWWSKILIETVQLFGETVTQYQSPTFYHNLPTNSTTYPALSSYFAAPITMTDQIEVAIARKGMLIDLIHSKNFQSILYIFLVWT